MVTLRTLLILFLAVLVHCQQEENDIAGTDIDEFLDTKNSTDNETLASFSEGDETNTTDGDTIYTRGTDTIDDLSTGLNVSSYPSSTEQPFENVTSTDEIEANWTACALRPCRNGGDCQDDPLDPSIYSCLCKTGYTGSRCGVIDECSTDEKGNVCYKGYCVYSDDGKSRACKCFFGMFWDELKKECRAPEHPCFPNPCYNGGTCTAKKNSEFKCDCKSGYEGESCEVQNKCGTTGTCDNGQCIKNKESNIKYCECFENFYWDDETNSCEDVIAPCQPNPCQNKGICESWSDVSYNCTCSGHYIDFNCTLPDHCFSSEGGEQICGGEGTCKVSTNSTECICNRGYYLDEEVHTCREIKDPCLPNPCLNDGMCVPLNSRQYNCTCSTGYNGSRCEEHDLCILQGGATFCGNATCQSDHDLEIFHCVCPPQQYFDFSARKCSNLDFCPLIKCESNEFCNNSECFCQNNYKWNNGTGMCEAHFCRSNPCPIDDMMCTEGSSIQDYNCSCKQGYGFNGTHCNAVGCIFPSLNECEQTCEISEDGHDCKCSNTLFKLKKDNKTCEYVGNTTCTNKTCDMGTCLKTADKEICICRPGFTEVEGQCVDACTARALPIGYCPGNQCEPTTTGFQCKCEGKYVLSKDKVTCTIRRVCQKGEVGWMSCAAKNAVCVEDWKSELGYKCNCTHHQVENDGKCEDFCSNEENQRQCFALGAKCEVNIKGKGICKCPPLYQKIDKGESCSTQGDISYFLTIPLDLDTYKTSSNSGIMKRSLVMDTEIDEVRVKNDFETAMANIFPQLTQINLLTCQAKSNYYICKVELQFKSITDNDLKQLTYPNICHKSEYSPDTCLIPPSLVVKENRMNEILEIQETNPCDKDLKESFCGSNTYCATSDMKSFNCTCKPGFAMRDKKFPFDDTNSFIESCNDIDECLENSACPKYTKCLNTLGSYTCSCVAGYRIKNKSSDTKIDGCVEICNPNPCDRGSCEKKGDHEFECRCDEGFAGALCDLQDANFKHARTNTIIVGVVLGGALLITIILFIITVLRLKKSKFQEEPDHMLYATEMNERRGATNNAFQRE